MGDKIRAFAIWEPASLGSKPREDYLAIDLRTNSFAVADGVSLYEGIEYVGKYPRVSGSYLVSSAFCRAFINHFARNPKSTILAGFRAGNAAAKKINKNKGRSKYDVLKKHKNLFAATAAMGRIRGRILEWGQISDAGVVVMDKSGKIKFWENDYNHDYLYWPKDIEQYKKSSQYTFFSRTLARNIVNKTKDGQFWGNGIITGERESEHYLKTSECYLRPGDVAILHTDGFRHYIKELPSFRKAILVARSEKELRDKIEQIISAKTKPFKETLKGYKINWRASNEVIDKKLEEIFGSRTGLANKWTKEKSIIIIKT